MTKLKLNLIIIGLSLVVILTSIVVVNEKLSKEKEELSKLPGNFLAESAGSQTLPEIVINKEFPNPPEKLPVYKVDNPTINEKTVAAFAEKFGISGPVTFDVFTNTYQVAGKVHVSKTTGDFWITLEDPWNQPPPKSLPDESICREIATSYLKEKGLFPKDAYFWGCGGASNQNLTPDGLVTEKTVVQVLFRQKINGYKAEGPGSKLSVFIGDKGKVLAVSRIWRQPKFYNKYPLISLEEAIKSLKDGKAVCSDTSDMGKIILENVEIAYYESGWGEKQLYLQPVYKFDGKSLSDNRKFHAYLPAVQPAYLEEKTLSKEDWQPSEPNIKEKNEAIHNRR